MGISVPPVQPIPDTYTPVTSVGELLIDAMQPWRTLHLSWLLDAIGVMLSPVYDLVTEQGVDGEPGYVPGYGALTDPTLASGSELLFLAQLVGVDVPTGSSDATARALVTAEAGLARGTDAAVIAAAKRTLTGTKTVYYFPRTFSDGSSNAGWAGLVMLTGECASLSATQAAVESVKLSGIQMWYSLIAGWTIGGLEGAYTLISDVEAAFVTVGGAEGDIPGA